MVIQRDGTREMKPSAFERFGSASLFLARRKCGRRGNFCADLSGRWLCLSGAVPPSTSLARGKPSSFFFFECD